MATMVTERPTAGEQIVKWQSFFDEQLHDVGVRASPPVLGQSTADYVRETCRTLKRAYLPENNKYYRVNYRGLPDDPDLLRNYASLLVGEVRKQRLNPSTVPYGEFREITRLIPGLVTKNIASSDKIISAGSWAVLAEK